MICDGNFIVVCEKFNFGDVKDVVVKYLGFNVKDVKVFMM